MLTHIPATVPKAKRLEYLSNWRLATQKSGRLMLFAGDQKIEHLNNDFFGPGIHSDDADPEHLFKIAQLAKVGTFAAQLGLIAAYGRHYQSVPYLIKLNGKTDLIPGEQADPFSLPLTTIEQVIDFKKNSGLKVVGIGLTIYPGAAQEAAMLSMAGQMITEAHQQGLLAVLWAYPRGQAVKQEKNPHLIAGCAGLAAALGADFVKLNYPQITKNKNGIKEIIRAAGRTGVIFSGGPASEPKEFLKLLSEQIKQGARGNATGRNIHQRSLAEAVRFAQAIKAVSCLEASPVDAYNQYYLSKTPKKTWLNNFSF